MEALLSSGEVPEGLDDEYGQALLQAVPARGVVQGLAWEGCPEKFGVAEASGGYMSMCVRSLVGPAGLSGAGWSSGREAGGAGVSQVLVVRGPCTHWSAGARWWCLGGLWMEIQGVCGLLSRLLHIWVIYNMVVDGTHHVFPGGGVVELLSVSQQQALAMRHLCRCAHPHSLAARPPLMRVVLGIAPRKGVLAA